MKFLLVVASLWLVLVDPALAHAFLENAEPKVGSVVAISPREIRLKFTEPIEPALSQIALADSSGHEMALGEVEADAKDRTILFAPIESDLAAGTYHVSWQVVSVDTHQTSGDFEFEVRP